MATDHFASRRFFFLSRKCILFIVYLLPGSVGYIVGDLLRTILMSLFSLVKSGCRDQKKPCFKIDGDNNNVDK